MIAYPFEQIEEPLARLRWGVVSLKALHDSFVPSETGLHKSTAGGFEPVDLDFRFTGTFPNLVSFLFE